MRGIRQRGSGQRGGWWGRRRINYRHGAVGKFRHAFVTGKGNLPAEVLGRAVTADIREGLKTIFGRLDGGVGGRPGVGVHDRVVANRLAGRRSGCDVERCKREVAPGGLEAHRVARIGPQRHIVSGCPEASATKPSPVARTAGTDESPAIGVSPTA